MVDWIVESGRKGEGQTQVSVECGDWACPPAAALQGFKRTALTTSNSTGACRRRGLDSAHVFEPSKANRALGWRHTRPASCCQRLRLADAPTWSHRGESREYV